MTSARFRILHIPQVYIIVTQFSTKNKNVSEMARLFEVEIKELISDNSTHVTNQQKMTLHNRSYTLAK